MYEYFDGEFVIKAPTHVVVDVGGVGYFVHISLNTFSAIKDQKGGKLFLSFQVREDAHTLYGFSNDGERRLFEHLISVSGIGPNTGRMILSSLSPDEIQSAIASGNVPLLRTIKGIGPKTAQRMILELQDKLSKEAAVGVDPSISSGGHHSREEATRALVLLGFQRTQIDKRLGSILSEQPTIGVEELIKEALKRL